jgi:hypothetical protein
LQLLRERLLAVAGDEVKFANVDELPGEFVEALLFSVLFPRGWVQHELMANLATAPRTSGILQQRFQRTAFFSGFALSEMDCGAITHGFKPRVRNRHYRPCCPSSTWWPHEYSGADS